MKKCIQIKLKFLKLVMKQKPGIGIARRECEEEKPLATNVQKRDQDIYQAYCNVLGKLDQIRPSVDQEFTDWFKEADETALKLDT